MSNSRQTIDRAIRTINETLGTTAMQDPPFQNAVRDLVLALSKPPEKGTRYVVEMVVEPETGACLDEDELDYYVLPKASPLSRGRVSGKVLACVPASEVVIPVKPLSPDDLKVLRAVAEDPNCLGHRGVAARAGFGTDDDAARQARTRLNFLASEGYLTKDVPNFFPRWGLTEKGLQAIREAPYAVLKPGDRVRVVHATGELGFTLEGVVIPGSTEEGRLDVFISGMRECRRFWRAQLAKVEG